MNFLENAASATTVSVYSSQIDKSDASQRRLSGSASFLLEFQVVGLGYAALLLSVFPVLKACKDTDLKESNQKQGNNGIGSVLWFKS